MSMMSLKGRRALFISYNGMLEPLGQSQVIPYLRGLAAQGLDVTLLSFERAAAFTEAGTRERQALKKQLAASGIDWHWLTYHKRFSVPATAYDVLAGILYASRLVKQKRIELVHARSHIPATIALALKNRFNLKMVFDVRGLMAEEYVDAGHWRRGSLAFRLIKTAERRALAASDGVVTLTEKIWPILRDFNGLRGRKVVHEVIPCCADLSSFRFREQDRVRRRAELGIGSSFTAVYCGQIDGWYLTEEMADFFAHLLRKRSDAHFLWLSPDKHERIKKLMSEREIGPDSYSVIAVPSGEVGSYLSASDVGVAFIKPCFSKLASSPTKVAEYLACGLPIVITTGIGDSDEIMGNSGVGTTVSGFFDSEYRNAWCEIERLVENASETRTLARQLAQRLFDLRTVGCERYVRLYEKIFQGT